MGQFYKKCQQSNSRLPGLLQNLPGAKASGKRLFLKLSRKIIDVVGDPEFEPVVTELRWRCEIFDQLRCACARAEPSGQHGLNDEGSAATMASIESGVAAFQNRLQKDVKLANDPLCRKMAQQIDRYADKLFADPIRVQTPSGALTVYSQRSNNIIEQFFRSLRRDHRRRTGDDSMHRALQTMLADTPLVKNLANPDYMQVLLDGKQTLEELFAELDMDPATKKFAPAADADRMLPGL